MSTPFITKFNFEIEIDKNNKKIDEKLEEAEKIKNLMGNGYKGVIKPTTPPTELTTLPDGIYLSYGVGTYLFNPALQIVQGSAVNVIPDGYSVKFSKINGTWSVASVEKLPEVDLSDVQVNSLTYRVINKTSNTSVINNLVKNINIYSDLININNCQLDYIQLNVNSNKFLIQFKIGDKYAAFFIKNDDIRNLSGNKIELYAKSENTTLINNTRVIIEFNRFDTYPTDVIYGASANLSYELLLKSFNNYNNGDTLIYNTTLSTSVNLIAYNKLVRNVYISSNDSAININTLIWSYIGLNSTNDRKLLFQFIYNGKPTTFGVKSLNPKADFSGKLVEIPYSEDDKELSDKIKVLVEFNVFEEFPIESFTATNTGYYEKVKFTENAFKKSNDIELLKPKNVNKHIKEVNVSKSQGNNAIQLAINSITDASINNRYKINVSAGVYEAKKPSDFIGNPGYPSVICPKNNIDIEGIDKTSTIISSSFDDDTSGTAIDLYQTMYNYADDVKVSRLKMYTKGLRYVLHQDNGAEANRTRYYEDVDFIFESWQGYGRPLGIGTFSGSKTYVKYGKSQSQASNAFSIHNNIAFTKPSLWHFTQHKFESLENTNIIEILNSGSNQDCEVHFTNCSFWNAIVIDYKDWWLYSRNVNDHFNHANFRITGGQNTPIYFKNTVKGATLCIETLSKTKDSKVRFDINSSAYSILIANHLNNNFGNLGNPNRRIKDGYVIQDGANGIAGFAFGGKSIYEGVYTQEKRQSYDNLGTRLGDCTNSSKTLGIIINGTTYNVVFNKNYTTYTNAQVLSDINEVIGAVATAKEYNIGADYHAEFVDVVGEVMSGVGTVIPKGTMVSKIGSLVKICGENDKPYGLLIDDLAPKELDSKGVLTCKARVIRNCYISLDTGNVSSARYSGNGARYKIINGVFTADANGTHILENSKYILI